MEPQIARRLRGWFISGASGGATTAMMKYLTERTRPSRSTEGRMGFWIHHWQLYKHTHTHTGMLAHNTRKPETHRSKLNVAGSVPDINDANAHNPTRNKSSVDAMVHSSLSQLGG